jgi:hypothetical protein
MKTILQEEINKIKYLENYKRGVVVSEQNVKKTIIAFTLNTDTQKILELFFDYLHKNYIPNYESLTYGEYLNKLKEIESKGLIDGEKLIEHFSNLGYKQKQIGGDKRIRDFQIQLTGNTDYVECINKNKEKFSLVDGKFGSCTAYGMMNYRINKFEDRIKNNKMKINDKVATTTDTSGNPEIIPATKIGTNQISPTKQDTQHIK